MDPINPIAPAAANPLPIARATPVRPVRRDTRQPGDDSGRQGAARDGRRRPADKRPEDDGPDAGARSHIDVSA